MRTTDFYCWIFCDSGRDDARRNKKIYMHIFEGKGVGGSHMNSYTRACDRRPTNKTQKYLTEICISDPIHLSKWIAIFLFKVCTIFFSLLFAGALRSAMDSAAQHFIPTVHTSSSSSASSSSASMCFVLPSLFSSSRSHWFALRFLHSDPYLAQYSVRVRCHSFIE